MRFVSPSSILHAPPTRVQLVASYSERKEIRPGKRAGHRSMYVKGRQEAQLASYWAGSDMSPLGLLRPCVKTNNS